jgi:S-adenosylhomocysteine hydrolase
MEKENYNASLLDYVTALFPSIDLKDTLLITCQHVLGEHVDLLDALIKIGLSPENVYWLGKCYSTNKETADTLENKGIYLHPASKEFDSHVAFDDQHKKVVTDLLERVKKEKSGMEFKHVVILDDGGELISISNEVLSDWKNIVGVEWTSSGFNRLKEMNISFPIINMARSEAKLIIESPFIAEQAVNKIVSYLEKLNQPKVLVIGGGYIGTNIVSLLEPKYEVHSYDIVIEKSKYHKDEFANILGLYDVIIGCTGETVISLEHYANIKKGALLISVSSSDREFSAVNLRKQVKKTTLPHSDLTIDGLNLINCGFPVTFDGSARPVAEEKIAITIALAFASVCQAMETKTENGFTDLDKEIQQRIIDKFSEVSIL